MSGIPPTFSNGGPPVPPNLVWNEDRPPKIFPCSMHTEHVRGCDGKEPPMELESELQVEVLNEGREWARAGMNFMGVPAAYQGVLPVSGINVELVDLLMWLETVKAIIVENFDIDEFEFQEKFREKKLEFLRTIRLANEDAIKEQRIRQQISVAKKPGLLGPDGTPF